MRRDPDRVSEEVVAESVVAHLEEAGWDVYHEVVVDGPRADIIATLGHLVRVIEVKTSFTAAVVEQAWHWIRYAHFVHIATPKRRLVAGGRILNHFCRDHGIGRLTVGSVGWPRNTISVVESLGASLNRSAQATVIKGCLRPEHKTWGKAGNADNKYFTPWRLTCETWTEYVEAHPGCTIKELIENAEHHYSSDSTARSCAAQYINNRSIPGIIARFDGRKIILYPAGRVPTATGRGRRPKE